MGVGAGSERAVANPQVVPSHISALLEGLYIQNVGEIDIDGGLAPAVVEPEVRLSQDGIPPS